MRRPLAHSILFGAAGIAVAIATPAIAAPVPQHEDTQTWLDEKFEIGLAKKLDFSTETLVEITDRSSVAGLLLIRPLLTYRLNDHVSVGGGYTYVGADDHVGSDFNEHRIVEEATIQTSTNFARPTATWRSRLEQRFREGERGVSIRMRELVRLDIPIGSSRRLVGWSEIFLAVNRAAWSGRAGPSMIQSFAGARLQLSRNVAIEPGYLNQTYIDPGRNRVRHAFAIFLSTRL